MSLSCRVADHPSDNKLVKSISFIWAKFLSFQTSWENRISQMLLMYNTKQFLANTHVLIDEYSSNQHKHKKKHKMTTVHFS